MINKNDPRLTDFVLGELGEPEANEIRRAIDASPELADAVAEIQKTVSLLGSAYSAEPPLSLLDSQKEELANCVDEPPAPDESTVVPASRSGNGRAPGRRWFSIAVAAGLLGLLVGGAFYLNNPIANQDVATRMERIGELDNEQLTDLKERAGAESTAEKSENGIAQGRDGVDQNRELETLVDDYNRLVDDGKYDEAQKVAKKVQEVAPASEIAIAMGENSELLSLAQEMDRNRNKRGETLWQSSKSATFADSETAVDGKLNLNTLGDIGAESALADFDGQLGMQPAPTSAGQGLSRAEPGDIGDARGEPSEASRFFSGVVGGAAPGGGGGFGSGIGGGDGEAGSGGSPGGIESRGGSNQLNERPLGGSTVIGRGPIPLTFDGRSTTERTTGSVLDELLDQGKRSSQADGGLQDDAAAPKPSLTGAMGFEGRNANLKDPDPSRKSGERPAEPAAPLPPTVVRSVENQDLPAARVPSTSLDAKSGSNGVGGGGGRQETEPGDSPIPSESKNVSLEQAKFAQLGINVVDKSNELGQAGEADQGMRSRPTTRSKGTLVEGIDPIATPANDAASIEQQQPQRFYYLAPQESEKLVDNLARRIDPDGKREFTLEELLKANVEPSRDSASPEQAAEVQLARLLSKQLAEGAPVENAAPQFGTPASGKSTVDASPLLKQLKQTLAQRNAEARRNRSWKRVKAIPNTTRLFVGDKDELDLSGMQVNVQVDGFRARVLIDCFYYNDRDRQLEGNFKLRLPDDASLYYFAFGESAYDFQAQGELAKNEFQNEGTQFVSLAAPDIRKAREDAWRNVKEARMVPREKAAHAYRETVRQKIDPALVEWSGAGVFNARVFPLAAHKLHRIVIGYDMNLAQTDDGWVYELQLPEQTGECRVDLNVQPIDGVEYKIEPENDPFQDAVAGKNLRRYRFDGPQKNLIRLTATHTPDVLLHSRDEKEGDFWGTQVTPDLPAEVVAGNPRAIFLVDTSLSSDPDKFNVWIQLLESTLSNNRDSLKQFGVLFFSVDGHFWQDRYVDNTPENVAKLKSKCESLALEGATDLYGAIEKIGQANWVHDASTTGGGEIKGGGEIAAGPDLFLLSDGAANWGETNLRLIERQLADHQLGSLFAYQTGLTGTAISGLRFLAGQSGGAVFSVSSESEIKSASTAHRKRPWLLKSITADGASDVLTAGRVQWVYPGQSLTVVGRGVIDGQLEFQFEQAGRVKTVALTPVAIESELASRLYGQVAVGQLESLGAKVFDVAASYARHFRVTGETCSLLMLESEADYKRFDIKPEEDLFVIKSKAAQDLVADILQKSAAELADPKSQWLAWLQRLETMPGMQFKMPTALGLVLEEIQVVAISKPLDSQLIDRDQLSDAYRKALDADKLDYDLIAAEASRRGGTSVDDAVKVFSSLVERNPGDLVVARDVAFTAMELGRPAQAYHLLRKISLARPFQGNIYPAMGQCLTQLGQADMAIVYYEVALGGTFQRQGAEFKQIVSAEYMHLLRQVVSGKLESSVKPFAEARLETLKESLKFDSANLLITMMWNTDQTDVDLHVIEPTGEECSYENKKTRTGGQITSDITTGFGPEMYYNTNAPQGKYEIQVKYFASDQNRTGLRNKVHLTIFRGFGTDQERVTKKTIVLKTVGEKESIATVGIE